MRTADPTPAWTALTAARRLWADMRAAGLVIKEQPYTLNVPRSQRGGEIVEPMISHAVVRARSSRWRRKPWKLCADGRIKIVPEHFTKVYYNWLENIQRLVHQPPAVVGAPHPGLVLR